MMHCHKCSYFLPKQYKKLILAQHGLSNYLQLDLLEHSSRLRSIISQASKTTAANNTTSSTDHQFDEDQSSFIRLSRRMSQLNLCSRREADSLISQSSVLLNGLVVEKLGTKVNPTEINIQIIHRDREKNHILSNSDEVLNWNKIRGDIVILNKPKDYVSGQPDPKHGHPPAVRLLTRNNIYFPTDDNGMYEELKYTLTSGKYLNFARRFHDNDESNNPSTLLNYAPAGRLDLDSTGLLVFTKNGLIAKRILSQSIDKEYIVQVEPVHNITRQERRMGIERLPLPRWDLNILLRKGRRLWDDHKPMKPLVEAKWIEEGKGKDGEWNGCGTIKFILREGKKRQIRRMCREILGLNVLDLKRVRVGSVSMGDLPEGSWRCLTEKEVKALFQLSPNGSLAL